MTFKANIHSLELKKALRLYLSINNGEEMIDWENKQ